MSTDHLRAVSARIHESFARQGLMRTMPARLVRIEKGVVEIEVLAVTYPAPRSAG